MSSSTQFTIRHLLALMAVVAVVFAAGSPLIRTLGTEAQLHFAVNAVVLVVLTAVFAGYRCVMRRRVERLAGEVVLHTTTQGNRYARVIYLLLLLGFVAALFYGGIDEALIAQYPDPAPESRLSEWIGFAYMAWITAWLVTNCWWGVGAGLIELADKGVIDRGMRFQPYYGFRTFRWNRYSRDVLVLSSVNYQTIQINVPEQERQHIEQFLKERNLISSQIGGFEDDVEPTSDR